jgi:hypothetical protein
MHTTSRPFITAAAVLICQSCGVKRSFCSPYRRMMSIEFRILRPLKSTFAKGFQISDPLDWVPPDDEQRARREDGVPVPSMPSLGPSSWPSLELALSVVFEELGDAIWAYLPWQLESQHETMRIRLVNLQFNCNWNERNDRVGGEQSRCTRRKFARQEQHSGWSI